MVWEARFQASDVFAPGLARRYGRTEQTVWKWRDCDSVHDCGHMGLRKMLPVFFAYLFIGMREFLNPDISCSAGICGVMARVVNFLGGFFWKDFLFFSIYDFVNFLFLLCF